MNKELQDKLYNDFPDLFQEKDLPMSETCMCWGLECDDGWEPLIRTMCEQLKLIQEWSGTKVIFQQIKEKFGSGRFYHTIITAPEISAQTRKNIWDIVDAVVSDAERKTSQTCEVSGKYGFLHNKGAWFKTLNPEEAEKLGYVKTIR